MGHMGRELLMLVPNLAILTVRLASDKRLPRESKFALLAAAAYFVSPIDLLPDFIPVLGHVDDLLALLLIIDGVLNHLDPDLVREHWRGDYATLERMQRYAAISTRFIPQFMKEKLFNRGPIRRSPITVQQ
jgi:uncharacterized membrane protein YkvA (DUF1232 family)